MSSKELQQYQILPIDHLAEFFSMIKCHQVIDSQKCSYIFATVTDLPQPAIYNLETKQVQYLNAKGAPSSPFTCIDISADLSYIVTGHLNGSVAIWSIPDLKFIKSIDTKKGADSVTFVAFGYTSEYIFYGDKGGKLYSIVFRKGFMGYKMEQRLLFTANHPISSVYASNCVIENSPAVGFATFGSYYLVFNQKLVETPNNPIIAQPWQLDGTTALSMITKDGAVFVAVAGGKDIQYWRWNSNYTCTQVWSKELENEQVHIINLLTSTITVVITTKGTMNLYTNKGGEVSGGQFENYTEIFSGRADLMVDNDKILLVSKNMPAEIIFTEWKQKIDFHLQRNEYETVFNMLLSIAIGTNDNLLGLSSNNTIRRQEVCKIGRDVSEKYIREHINSPSLPSDLSYVITYTYQLGIARDVITKTFALFKDNNKLKEFFTGVFANATVIGQVITADIVKEYFNYAEANKILDHAEDTITNLTLDPDQAKAVLILARERKMVQLQKKILLRFYQNIILAAQVCYEAGTLAEFVFEIFSKKREPTMILNLTTWLMIPHNNTYDRMNAVINNNWDKVAGIISQMIELCPINFNRLESIQPYHIIDAALNSIKDVEYMKCAKLVETIMPIMYTLKVPYNGAAITNVCTWIFTTSQFVEARECILQQITENYKDSFPMDLVADTCLSCGFVNLAESIFIKNKDYQAIIQSYLSSNEKAKAVFDFIEDHLGDHDAIKIAMMHHISALLAANALRTVRILKANFEDSIETLKKQLKGKDSLVFIEALFEITEDKKAAFDANFMLETFKLYCQYDTSNAAHFLNRAVADWTDFDLDEALKASQNYHLIDCEIIIHRLHSNASEACKLIDDEIELALLELIDSDIPVEIADVAQMKKISSISRQYNAVMCAIQLLESLDDKETETIQRWIDSFLAFQFPLYHMKSKSNTKLKACITQLFTYFVMAALNHLRTELVFATLTIYFCAMDQSEYRTILNAIFARANYQVQLYGTVEEMLINDCLKLCNKAFEKTTSGYAVTDDYPKCAICQQPLSYGGSQIRVYPCGHAIHNNSICGNYEKCILCNGDKREAGAVSAAKAKKDTKLALRKFNFAMQKNYSDSETQQPKDILLFSPAPYLDGEPTYYNTQFVGVAGSEFKPTF